MVKQLDGEKISGVEMTVIFTPDTPMDEPDSKVEAVLTVPPGTVNVAKLQKSKESTSYTPATAGVLAFNFQAVDSAGKPKRFQLNIATITDEAINAIVDDSDDDDDSDDSDA